MTKLSRKYLSSDKFGLYINNLWAGFTLMDSKEDIRLLFRDLFTHTEYKMLAKRLEIARRLLAGQGYYEIIKQLNVTGRTIANINNILAEKGEGFRKVDNKLSAIEKECRDKETNRIERLSKPFKRPAREKELITGIFRGGLEFIDKKISARQKSKSAGKTLSI